MLSLFLPPSLSQLPSLSFPLLHHPLTTPTTHPLTTPTNDKLDACYLALFLYLATPVSHPLSVRLRMTRFSEAQDDQLPVRLRMTSGCHQHVISEAPDDQFSKRFRMTSHEAQDDHSSVRLRMAI